MAGHDIDVDPDRKAAAEAAERELALLFRRARSLSMTLAPLVHPGLDPAAYGLLMLIDDAVSVRAAEMVDKLGLDKSTVSRQMAQLEDLGLVERVPDPTDGRARLAQLTESGKSRLHQVRAQRRGRLREYFTTWSTSDMRTLAILLGRLNEEL